MTSDETAPHSLLISFHLVLVFRPSAAVLETLRCVVMVAMQRYGYVQPLTQALAVPTQVRHNVCWLHSSIQTPVVTFEDEQIFIKVTQCR